MGGALLRRYALVSSLHLFRMMIEREWMVVVCNWVWIFLMCMGGGGLKRSVMVFGGSVNLSLLVGSWENKRLNLPNAIGDSSNEWGVFCQISIVWMFP